MVGVGKAAARASWRQRGSVWKQPLLPRCSRIVYQSPQAGPADPPRPAGSTARPLLSVSFAVTDSRLLLGVEGAAQQPTSPSHAAGIYGEVSGVDPTAPTRAGHFTIAYDWRDAQQCFGRRPHGASQRGEPLRDVGLSADIHQRACHLLVQLFFPNRFLSSAPDQPSLSIPWISCKDPEGLLSISVSKAGSN